MIYFSYFLIILYFVNLIFTRENFFQWKYRRTITILNPTKKTGTEDILLIINTEDLINTKKLKEDCNDFRFAIETVTPYPQPNEYEFLGYWVEGPCMSQESNIWIKMKLKGETEEKLEVIYGYSDVPRLSDDVDIDGHSFIGQFVFLTDKNCSNGTYKIDMFNDLYLKSGIGFGKYGGEKSHTHSFVEPFFKGDELGATNRIFAYNASDLDSEPANVYIEPHYHSLSMTPSTNDDVFPYFNLNFCFSSTTVIPLDSIILFNNTSILSIPDGYLNLGNHFSDGDLLIRGTPDHTLYGNVVGDSEIGHTHTFSQPETGASYGNYFVGSKKSGPWYQCARQGHKHMAKGGFSLENNITFPPFYSLLPIRKNEDTDQTTLPKDSMIILSTIVPKYGYEIFEQLEDRYPLLSNLENRHGGNESHDHYYDIMSGNFDNVRIQLEIPPNPTNKTVYHATRVGSPHEHRIHGRTSSTKYDPEHTTSLFIIRKKTLDLIIGDELEIINEKEIQKQNEKEDLEKEFRELFANLSWGVVASIGILIFSLFCCICFFLCCLCKVSQKPKKGSFKEYKELMTAGKLFPNELNQKEEFTIKKDLFKIEMDDVKIIKKIGEGGGNSSIYKALWKEKEVAFKIFKIRSVFGQGETTTSENLSSSIEEFEREISIMASINHPNLISFYGLTYKYPRIGIIMQMCENGDLQDWVNCNKGNIENDKKVKILKEICDGMEYLHDRNIIHRDLKSQNVLLDVLLSPKIIDFGLSRVINKHNDDKKLTKRVGTSQYMAPEICISGNYTNKVDVFSFSIMIWEIIFESFNPYGNDLTFSVELKVANDASFRPKIDEKNKNFKDNKWIIDLMKQCWSADPEDRPDFLELKGILNKFLVKDFFTKTQRGIKTSNKGLKK